MKIKEETEIALLLWSCLYDVKECWVREEMQKKRYRGGGEREEKREVEIHRLELRNVFFVHCFLWTNFSRGMAYEIDILPTAF